MPWGRFSRRFPPRPMRRWWSPSTARRTPSRAAWPACSGTVRNLPVADANDKTPIEPGHVYLAPPDYHLLVQPGYFSLSTDDRVHFARPSIDVLFESAADAYRERVVGVILTGANADGAAGLSRIKRSGGVAVVQDPLTAERNEMPGAALAATAADAILPLGEIGPFLYGLLCEPAGRMQTT